MFPWLTAVWRIDGWGEGHVRLETEGGEVLAVVQVRANVAWTTVIAVGEVRNGWILNVLWRCNWQDLLTDWTWRVRERGTLRRAPRCQPQTDTEFFIPCALRNPVLPQSSYHLWILRVLLFLVWSPLALVFPLLFVSWFPSVFVPTLYQWFSCNGWLWFIHFHLV